MADIKKKFGVKIFQLRSKAEMTQAELTEKANLSTSVKAILSEGRPGVRS